MPKCTDEAIEFGRVGRRVVQAAFDVGDIVSDGGVLLLRQLDERRTRKDHQESAAFFPFGAEFLYTSALPADSM